MSPVHVRLTEAANGSSVKSDRKQARIQSSDAKYTESTVETHCIGDMAPGIQDFYLQGYHGNDGESQGML